jgi:hypothetical protein
LFVLTGATIGQGSFGVVKQAILQDGAAPLHAQALKSRPHFAFSGTFIAVKQFPVVIDTPQGQALVQSALSEIQVCFSSLQGTALSKFAFVDSCCQH